MTICEDWTTAAEVDQCGATGADPAIVASAITASSEILYALSGRQYAGLCSETIRPCKGGDAAPGFSWGRWSYPWIPIRSEGTWLNIGPACGCHVSYDCGCKGIPQVNLGRDDVTQIFSVNLSGTDFNSFRLDEGRWLVRTDGGHWPCCQDLSKDIGEAGTWYIELEYGRRVPESGRLAASKLANQLARACVGAECDLPQRVTTITRQGATLTMLDPQDFLQNGKTGLYEVDLFLSSVNPHGIARQARAWSPDLPTRRRVEQIGS